MDNQVNIKVEEIERTAFQTFKRELVKCAAQALTGAILGGVMAIFMIKANNKLIAQLNQMGSDSGISE